MKQKSISSVIVFVSDLIFTMTVRSYAFNWAYLKRFWSLQKIFFPAFATYSSGLMAFLLVVSALEEFVAFKVILRSRFKTFDVVKKNDKI